jgi:hypothetical protein
MNVAPPVLAREVAGQPSEPLSDLKVSRTDTVTRLPAVPTEPTSNGAAS